MIIKKNEHSSAQKIEKIIKRINTNQVDTVFIKVLNLI